MSLILLSQWIHVSSANAILTATSSQVIVGNTPQVVALSSADKHGFTVNGVFYSEASGTIKSSEVKEFDGNLTLNDFKVAIYTSTNLDKVENYSDIDGDNADPQQPFKVEMTNYWWYDNNGVRIIGDDKKKIIGCGSGFSMPLKLIIKTNVRAHSAYGIPDEGEPITLAKTYQIAPKSQICYAKPNATVVYQNAQWHGFDENGNSQKWNLENSIISPEYGGGRTSDYVLDFGFKAKPTYSSKTFPTTGFPGAQFQLVMTGAQTDYEFSVITQTKDVVDVDSLGSITLKKKPLDQVIVQATLKRDRSVKHDYSFNPTSIWAIPQGDFKGYWNVSQTKCGSAFNVLSRGELTNSPQRKAPMYWQFKDNNYTRAIGEGLTAEWGPMNKISYPNSEWRDAHYWTRDNYSSELYFVVHSVNGGVGYGGYENKIGQINHIACKG
ncbi:hypothetical protein A9G41_13100 [Gilliamella sp. Nev5-1]|uniref:hypothetical protein n=1 Tax=Gilliamella sp. Nev5-1 TaxID=3120251 RepID=UPI0008278474|nr:hypothetical protein [Gilliamella apicola]OCG66051.1 hypothetical protein A9G41_13100 [Gilliamella apicola]